MQNNHTHNDNDRGATNLCLPQRSGISTTNCPSNVYYVKEFELLKKANGLVEEIIRLLNKKST